MSLNSLIAEAVKEYCHIRLTAVVEGQRIVNRFADFAPIMQARTTKEEQAALHAAQRQALFNLSSHGEGGGSAQAAQAAPELAQENQAQAPTALTATEARTVEDGREGVAPAPAVDPVPVEAAEPVQTVEPVESAAPVEEALQTVETVEGQNQEQATDIAQAAEPVEVVETAPAEQKAVKDMSQEELLALVEDKRGQGVNDYAIAQELRNGGLKCDHIGKLIGKSQSSISRNTTAPNGK